MPYILMYNGYEYNLKWYKLSYNIPFLRNINTNKITTCQDITRTMQKIFKETGNNITINMLRKIVITEFYKNERTYDEKKTFAKKMGHSYITSQTIYNKIV